MPRLNIDIEHPAEDVTLVRLAGDAGVGELDKLEMQFNRVRAAKPNKVIIDLAGLAFIASIGMGSMVSLNSSIAKAGAKVILTNVNEQVMTALQRARLDNIFGMADSVDAALAD